MAISQEALSSPAVVLTPTTAAMQYSKVARLEHFVGRRSSDYRYRADPGPFDPYRLNEEFDELTIRFEPEQTRCGASSTTPSGRASRVGSSIRS